MAECENDGECAHLNCCDCGERENGCGCRYCWSCNACDACYNDTED